MKTEFSLKLFITFLVFGIILFFISSFLAYNIFDKKLQEKSFLEFSTYVKSFEKDLKELVEDNRLVIESIYRQKSLENFDKKSLAYDIKTIISTHDDILEVSIRNNFGKELLNIQSNEDIVSREVDLMKLIKLKPNKFWFSDFTLSRKDSEIEYPLMPTIYFVKKTKEHTIIVHTRINSMFNSLDKIQYLLDKDGNFIYDESGQNSWSKFYNFTTVNDVFLNFDSRILESDLTKTYEYFYKTIKVDNKRYLVAVSNSNFLTIESFLDDYDEAFYNFAFLTFVISLILSMIFTSPLSTINRRLLDEKDDLQDSINRDKLILTDSLEVINKHMMFIKMDINFNIIDVSSYFCSMTGYQKEELMGQHYSILYSKKDFEKIEKKMQNDLANSGKFTTEVLSQRKIGTEYWVKLYIEPNYENNKIISYSEIRIDISDNKKIENLYNDLNYQIEQLNTIFQSANSGIALIDCNGNFKRFNKAFIEIFKYNENEIVEKNLFDLVDKDSEKFLEEVVKEVESFGSISNVELIFLSKNMEDIYLNVSLKILPDRVNMVLVVNSLEDKRKLQELNQTLEQRVFEEVEKNKQKDMLHQEEKIRSAKLTSIGTLAAGITHEINTPLTYLKGNFEMLGMDIDDLPNSESKKDMLDSCKKIDDAIKRIAIIVESMREMSQTSTEVKELTNIFSTLVTSLTMAYNTSKQITRIYLNNKEFTLTNIEKNDYEAFAYVQKQRIEQVWVIIINNALDELKKIDSYEERKLLIDIIQESDELVIKFKDNAGGIKDDILPKIFEPFISTKVHGGMGIGLNIAKKIVNEQDGNLIAYNGKSGAVFEVRLKSKIED